MARLHRAYRKDAFNDHLLELTKRLIKEKPWRCVTLDEQERMLWTWCHGVEVILGVPAPRLVIAPQNGRQRRLVGDYVPAEDPRKATIILHTCSVISLLHNYRHHMQVLGERDLMDPREAQEAQEWACSLFYSVAPRRFRRMVEAGRIAGVHKADLKPRKKRRK